MGHAFLVIFGYLRYSNGLGHIKTQGKDGQAHRDQVGYVVRVSEKLSTTFFLQQSDDIDAIVEDGGHEQDFSHSDDVSKAIHVGEQSEHINVVIWSNTSAHELSSQSDNAKHVDLSIVNRELHDQGPMNVLIVGSQSNLINKDVCVLPCSVVDPSFLLQQLDSVVQVIDESLQFQQVSTSAVFT